MADHIVVWTEHGWWRRALMRSSWRRGVSIPNC